MTRPTSVVVLWFGSIDGHGTIGDLLSAQAVCNELASSGLNVVCASWTPISGVTVRATKDIDPCDYEAAVFVCGPIMRLHPELVALFDSFKRLPMYGVGVSLFAREHPNFFNPFDVVLAREGGEEVWPDVALAAPRSVAERSIKHPDEFIIGVSLRGSQSEYSNQNCLFEDAQVVASSIASEIERKRRVRVIAIEHRLADSGLDSAGIESAYESCDLIVTTRLHGALLALRHRVPFVAMDQIAGGAKVTGILAETGWPWVFRLDRDEPAAILRSLFEVSSDENILLLHAIASEVERQSATTLAQLSMVVLKGLKGPIQLDG